MVLREEIARRINGDVADDAETLKAHSRDTSIFERRPALVVYPKDARDVVALVRFARESNERGERVSLTARAAGTDMSGGPLTDSVVVSFTKHMNRIIDIVAKQNGKESGYVVAEPGIFYRKLEMATLRRGAGLIPSFPASRELCALGGMLANDSGGELTLRYGKTRDWVRELEVVLSDGSQATLKPLTPEELEAKKREKTLEGAIYRGMHAMIEEHGDEIERARPVVSKNSGGYALWEIFDRTQGTFDLSKLVIGSQGTLALVTKARVALAQPKAHKAMLVIFLSDLKILPEIVRRVMQFRPESFESYDDHTFTLAMKLLPQLLANMGILRAMRLGFAFLPELGIVIRGGIPKLILMAEFAEDTDEAARDKVRDTRHALEDLPVSTRMTHGRGSEKYWVVRREAFAILRKKLPGLTAAPFIDDFVVPPESYPEFLPRLFELLDAEKFIYAVTGHVGDGNFHIFPLVNLSQPDAHTMILELMPKVYALVKEFHGSTTGEHNDGIIRTPFLDTMFSPRMLALFGEVKRLWDPANILNPGKKVGGTLSDIERYMIRGPIS
ncbi:FAD-binding oxidoreductase [Candidatus Kaiserbacteria bacterium CG10_big_fil_rev_8_21_14_0_10_59_10]|uniref:FAD-binding oxidoreductase n=1 Tax=Candidatus Kaiserbacteria bacterium CG10_big_fil_rev_8_21_14_0_10_59_10 TaxID=1974612 RepID=A0A2H0U7F8_9BACT|nr:MAG: FAD-binding oxidoreductase [Candidatus Kaiserbacteria bacterium CG10_big_fil_rev_8_21_14_0_10_59_10]